MILKNTTASLITIQSLRSLQIPALSQVDTIDMISTEEINNNSELKSYIDSEDVVINDGNKDLSPTEANSYLTPVNNYTVTNTFITSGMTIETHEAIYSLAHSPNISRYEEYNRTGGQVSSVIIWTNPSKTQKVREEIYTRMGGRVTQIVINQYNSSGTLSKTETQTIARGSGGVNSITIGVI